MSSPGMGNGRVAHTTCRITVHQPGAWAAVQTEPIGREGLAPTTWSGGPPYRLTPACAGADAPSAEARAPGQPQLEPGLTSRLGNRAPQPREKKVNFALFSG